MNRRPRPHLNPVHSCFVAQGLCVSSVFVVVAGCRQNLTRRAAHSINEETSTTSSKGLLNASLRHIVALSPVNRYDPRISPWCQSRPDHRGRRRDSNTASLSISDSSNVRNSSATVGLESSWAVLAVIQKCVRTEFVRDSCSRARLEHLQVEFRA